MISNSTAYNSNTSLPDLRQLEANAVHAWFISLAAWKNEEIINQRVHLLSEDELLRAERFCHDSSKNRYIIARSSIRLLLSSYTGLDPKEIVFGYMKWGKPYLKNQVDEPIHFNLSHSENSMLVGLTKVGPIGVDIEENREILDASELVLRFFSDNETSEFNSLPAEHKTQGFWNAWTRKEAILKARGTGLITPLDCFDVTLNPIDPAQLLRIDIDGEETKSWQLNSFHPSKNSTAAIALKGDSPTQHSFTFEPPTSSQ